MNGLEGVYPPEENPSKGLEGAYPPNGISSKGLTVGYAMQDILKNAKTRVITTIQRDIFLIYENLIAIL